MEWRFIFTGFLSPFENMAIDEALFLSYFNKRIPTFRIYGWKPYGFSIGYSQKTDEILDLEMCKRDNICIVRRITGGSMIYHANEVTYSIVCSNSDIGNPESVKKSYKVLTSFILRSYEKMGLSPKYAIDFGGRIRKRSSFCFMSQEDYDIVIGNRKIGGNAQKRRRDVILIHGSIPIGEEYKIAEKYTREKLRELGYRSTCLSEITGRKIDFFEFSEILKESFKEIFGDLREGNLDGEEIRMKDKLLNEKYSKDWWNIYLR
ncbi:MAG TPA: lipoate--protein ligase family protein [Firmicutes bacterium]|nr:MAG: lipoate--protein ligase family protein [Candidatus Omnitrophota bacterium]HDD64553.1 lipoate--protein ligase family protein [Bacillota bacterium]